MEPDPLPFSVEEQSSETLPPEQPGGPARILSRHVELAEVSALSCQCAEK